MHKLILLSIERCFRWREKERETQESWKRGEACEDVCVCVESECMHMHRACRGVTTHTKYLQ